MLGRETEWRQGDIIKVDSLDQNLLKSFDLTLDSCEVKLVIASHDCDIASEKEPYVEILIGNIIDIDTVNSKRCQSAQNPRTLHLKYSDSKGNEYFLELSQIKKISIDKSKFGFAEKESLFISITERKVFKQWLAARYGRPAFPNAFENRLNTRTGSKTVAKKFDKLLAEEAKNLIGVFVDLGEGRDEELKVGEPYCIKIILAYDETEGGSLARLAAEKAKQKIVELFESVFGTEELATKICLESCEAVADTVLSLSDLRKIDQWRLEYVSLKDEQSGDFISTAEMPV